MLKHIPNALTVFRILLVPVFLYLVWGGQMLWAVVIFALAGFTDALDGFLARAYDLRTELGANLDPLADKLLLISAFVSLTSLGLIPVWLCAPVIARDALILSGVLALRGSGRKVRIAPSVSGKLTTVLQISTVLYAMVFAGKYPAAFAALTLATLLLTLYTGFDYARREIRIQRGSRAS